MNTITIQPNSNNHLNLTQPSSASPSPSSSSSTTINHQSITQPDQQSSSSRLSEFTQQLNQLNLKLVKSFELISNLEDELHESKQTINKLTTRNTLLELESAQHKEALKGGILVERANVQLELQRLTQRVTLESERRSQSEASLSTINQELDDLSVSLFTEANRLVAVEKFQRTQAERKVIEVEEAMKRVEEVIEARRDQTNHLRLSLEAAEAERDHYRSECESLRRNLSNDHSSNQPNNNPTSSIDSLTKSASTNSIIINSKDSLPTPLLNHPLSSIPPNDPPIQSTHLFSPSLSTPGSSHLRSSSQLKLSLENIPFTEFLQFVLHLRRIREEALPRPPQTHPLTESYFSPASAITGIIIAPPPLHRPLSSLSSSSSSFPSSKDQPSTIDPKDSIAPFLPLSQHLSHPFVKRCLEEDSDPTLRLDLAPGLNFMSRRTTLTALLEGNLVIEPVWSESGQVSEFQNCTLCGCPLDPWLSLRASSTGSTNHTPSNPSTAGSTMRKMLRGGAWSFGGIGKPKRSSHPVTSTHQAEKSTLAPSVSLKLPNSGRNTPNSEDSASLHIHTFKTADGSCTRYPICPTYCLARLRAVCHFWTFVRSLERGVLLDESFWFTHYINQPPASSRFTETHSLGLAYDHALKRIRGQNHSIDSVEGSPPLTHSIQSSVFNVDNNTLQPLDHTDIATSGNPSESNPDQNKSSSKDFIDDQVIIPTVEAHQALPDPELKPLQTPDLVRLSPLSPSPSPTSTTEHDVTSDAVRSTTTNHLDQSDPCGTSLTIRPTILSNEVPILSPAPAPALRRSLGRSISQTINSSPSMISKSRGTNEGPDSSNPEMLQAIDPYQTGGMQDSARSAHTEHANPRAVEEVTRLQNPPRSAPLSSLQNNNGHLRNQSQHKFQSSIELMDAGWEEKCWHQVVKLKEEMFFKRVGLSLVPS